LEKYRFLRKKKKIRRSAVCRLARFHSCPNENFVRMIFERCFQVRDFFFWITEGIGLTGVSFHFWPQNKFRQVAAIGVFGSFFTSMWNICQFLCFWAWCDVKFYAELKKINFMWPKVQSKAIMLCRKMRNWILYILSLVFLRSRGKEWLWRSYSAFF
jgi:hypothetical protein